ncbi:MAG: alpha/beta fold hydrolase [Actinomycetota bacterium]|uniref:Alpha/beta fold hydrolase n=1 Tax=Mycobacterium lentiflavum TaxID=141349 RepID=A0ABY3UP50_MYCLN|nr:alpha/beta fold hydrolase [Mycobacterium lentiflavum]MEE3062578.1 alpha/beta fold hydrolase [Actinomycetota bacterium]ULP40461.1 alpha/beta fold hydrolase [Mycobacterium lentiflavum]
MQTMEYAPGRLADVFGDPNQPAVLVWHGMQANARAVVRPLARLLAGHGATVVVVDWDSHSRDGGRADLLGSVEFMQQRSDRFVLVGWSMGGLAAAGLTLACRDVRLTHTVCLAGAFTAPDPITGRLPGDELTPGRSGPPFTLLHGRDDDVVPVTASRDFAAQLAGVGWPAQLVELAADHGSIAGAAYDPAADRYHAAEPANVTGEVAARIVAVLN